MALMCRIYVGCGRLVCTVVEIWGSRAHVIPKSITFYSTLQQSEALCRHTLKITVSSSRKLRLSMIFSVNIFRESDPSPLALLRRWQLSSSLGSRRLPFRFPSIWSSTRVSNAKKSRRSLYGLTPWRPKKNVNFSESSSGGPTSSTRVSCARREFDARKDGWYA